MRCGGTAVAAAGPEADLAYHGAASMAWGRVGRRSGWCCAGWAPAADGVGKGAEMRVRLRRVPSEVLLEIDTVWDGGTVDRTGRTTGSYSF